MLVRHTRKASDEYPDLDSNQGPDLRRVRCNPLHHRDLRSFKSRRLDSHQHQPVYKTGAFLCRATSAGLVVKHERVESNPVRQLWRLTALPGAHSCVVSRPRDNPVGDSPVYFSSGTFQYVSLINFDQLSIRTALRA